MSHETPYYIGQRILLTTKGKPFQRRKVDGTYEVLNPTTVTIRVRKPSGSIDTYAFPGTDGVTNPAVGVFELEIVIEPGEEGRWYFSFEGDGEVETFDEDSFYVADAHTT